MSTNKQALREEFQYMQNHYSDPADRERQLIYIAAEALLDELEALDRRNAELNSTLERWATDRAKSASELDDAEKRIAELETREVREEGNQFLVVRHPGKAPVIKHFTGELDAYLRQINEFDPLVTIDIIMHRYYGVGGQWVQDADEYLSAAGISVKGE